MLKKLSKDEGGSIDVAAYVLLATLIGIGMIVGVETFRTGLTQEYGDAAAALQRLDQSYEYTIRAPSGAIINQSVYLPPNSKGPNDTADQPPPGITISEGGILDDELTQIAPGGDSPEMPVTPSP